MSYLFEWDYTHANSFHNTAGPVLSELGFELVNDPKRINGPYQATNARYRNAAGMYLSIGFDPADGKRVGLSVGSFWKKKEGRWYSLSNYYYILARRLGISVPDNYPLDHEKMSGSMERVLRDLIEILPTILSNVTLEDLIAVEKEQYGAQKLAEGYLGDQYLDHVEISELTIESRD